MTNTPGTQKQSPSPQGKPRIAVLVPRLEVGGTERHLLEILPAIDRDAFAVSVVTTRGAGPLDGEMRSRGVPVVYATTRRARVPALIGAVFGVLGYLRRERPDIVHFFLPEAYLVGGLAALIGPPTARVVSRRSLNHYHNRRGFSAAIEKALHRRMDAVLANSRAVAAQLQHEGVAAGRLHTIYSGVDTGLSDGIARDEARRRIGLAPHALVLVCVANLIPYKGHGDLLEALALAAPRLPADWRMLMAGRDDGLKAGLVRQAERLNIADNICWLGQSDAVPAVLAASDIAVLASHEEGLPHSILEAMAAGLPAVVTRVGGSPEAVCDGETGYVVAPRDAAALAEAIAALARDEDMRRQMGAAGRARIDAHFQKSRCVGEYERIYRRLMSP